MTFLETILEHKAEEVARRRREHPIDELTGSIYFARSLRSLSAAIHQASPAIIAELKKASPSRGEIRKDFRPADFARGYEAAGACAISVLTDERFFSGSLRNLVLARDAVSIPVLRKDFIIDAYQIYEARAHGADAILLIVAALPPSQLTTLMEVATSLGLESLVEVHSKDELDVAVRAGAELIGVNNRDLHTFSVDLRTTIDLLPIVPRASHARQRERNRHGRADPLARGTGSPGVPSWRIPDAHQGSRQDARGPDRECAEGNRMSTRIKVCGITRADDAFAAVDLGADAIGFVFYSGSPRNASPAVARDVTRNIPPFVTTGGSVCQCEIPH